MTPDEPVEVYRAWNSWQAHFVCLQLADAGISAHVASNSVEAVRGEVPYQTATCPVWVDAKDAERSRAVMAEYERRLASHSPGTDAPDGSFCYHCGTALERQASPCPECGMDLDWTDESA
jgi:hypothetical protein